MFIEISRDAFAFFFDWLVSIDVWHRFFFLFLLFSYFLFFFFFLPPITIKPMIIIFFFYFILSSFYSGKHCITGTIPRDMRKDVGEDIFIVTSLQVFESSSACPWHDRWKYIYIYNYIIFRNCFNACLEFISRGLRYYISLKRRSTINRIIKKKISNERNRSLSSIIIINNHV